MRKRSKAREYALQILYQVDITGNKDSSLIAAFWQSESGQDADDEVKDFTSEIVKGVISNIEAIDSGISNCATNWQLKRMAVIDRNILRMGCYELVYRDDIPFKVSINEAVDLAKKYSGIEAGKFVNGILDKINSEKIK